MENTIEKFKLRFDLYFDKESVNRRAFFKAYSNEEIEQSILDNINTDVYYKIYIDLISDEGVSKILPSTNLIRQFNLWLLEIAEKIKYDKVNYTAFSGDEIYDKDYHEFLESYNEEIDKRMSKVSSDRVNIMELFNEDGILKAEAIEEYMDKEENVIILKKILKLGQFESFYGGIYSNKNGSTDVRILEHRYHLFEIVKKFFYLNDYLYGIEDEHLSDDEKEQRFNLLTNFFNKVFGKIIMRYDNDNEVDDKLVLRLPKKVNINLFNTKAPKPPIFTFDSNSGAFKSEYNFELFDKPNNDISHLGQLDNDKPNTEDPS